MKLETFKKGITDFTELVEKSEQADLKLIQEKNHFTVWLLGISTGAFIFLMANSREEFKAAFSGTIHLMLIIHATQVICSVLLRISINSFSVLKEQKVILLGVQELYLETNPKNEDLKEHDLFGLYKMLAEFRFIRPIIKHNLDPILERIDLVVGFIRFLFIAVVLLFLINYCFFLYAVW